MINNCKKKGHIIGVGLLYNQKTKMRKLVHFRPNQTFKKGEGFEHIEGYLYCPACGHQVSTGPVTFINKIQCF
jgi:hypothetical protein